MILDFILQHKEFLFILTISTIVTFLGSIILIPVLIINLSPDYFTKKRESLYHYKHPFIRYSVLILKNILGYILILLGVAMLFLPGQGLLSIAVGILFINFPGKKKLEYKFFSNKKIGGIVNLIRRRANKSEIFF